MSDGIPSAVQIVNELKAYMELKDKQVITAEQLKNAKILCKEMATMCLNVEAADATPPCQRYGCCTGPQRS